MRKIIFVAIFVLFGAVEARANIRLLPSNAVCNAANEGAMIYDNVTKKGKLCTGADWTEVGGPSGTICGNRSIHCNGDNPAPFYEVYGAQNIACNSRELATDCSVVIPANAPQRRPGPVTNCPTGFSGKFSATGVYYVPANGPTPHFYMNFYQIFCVKD